jgi:hypothetical protein
LDAWLARSHPLEAELSAKAAASLFDPARLAAAARARPARVASTRADKTGSQP